MVEIDKLITLQNGVYLDFVEKIHGKMPAKPSEEAVIDLCLSLTKEYAPVSRLKNTSNKFVYSSDSSDLRVIGSFSRPIETVTLPTDVMNGIPVRCLITLIGYGLPVASVLANNNKLVLTNGFHRLYALRARGVTHAPVVLQRVTNIEDVAHEIQTPFVNLVSMSRPPLMQDYFMDELTVEVKITPRKKVVKVIVESENLEVPLGNT